MLPHFSWSQVWALLRPQLKKLARRPVVWLAGLGLLVILAIDAWLKLRTPTAASPLLAGEGSPPDLLGNMGLVVSVTIDLALVIALIYGSLYLLRKWQGGWFSPTKKCITLLETTRLSPRQALHLVRVGERVLLVGATDQTVALLSEVDLPPQAEAAPAKANPTPPVFAAALDQALNQPDPAVLAPQGHTSVC